MFAKLTILARITEPKVIPGSNGNDFVTFSMAVNKWMGEGKEPVAEWYNFKAFKTNAERISKYPKGTMLLIEATPTMESWKDKKTGEDRKQVAFIVERAIPASSTSAGGEGASAAPARKTTVASKAAADDDLADPFADEEDPFGS